MRPISGSHIPSKSVLRFLRSQSEYIPQSTSSWSYSDRRATISQRTNSPRRCQSTLTPTVRARNGRLKSDLAHSTYCESLKALPAPQSSLQSSSSRHASTRAPRPARGNQWSSLWSKIRGRSRSKVYDEQSAQAGGYDDTSAQLFNLSRALARSPTATDLKLRCTEFDSNGSVTLVSGEFRKSELIAKYGLQPRDLRKIDSSVLPHILVRPSAILINLLHLRVLIQSDHVLVFDAYGSTDSYTQSLFMYDLEGKLRQKPDPRNTSTYLPYEFRALEAVLISVTSGLEAEFALVRGPVTHILKELEEDIDREKLRHLLIHSKKLGTFEQKARLVRDAINDLLEADDDLSTMYLTERKATGNPREEDDHQEIEMLLESYHKICDEIVEISGNLISNIRNTEEVVKAILDANRNQLMLLEIKFSIGTLGLAGGTLIAGLYGMNLNNFIEETNFGFTTVSVTSFILSALICVYGMRKLRKVQKVRMFGEGIDALGGSNGKAKALRELAGRSGWRNEAAEIHAWNQRLAALKQRDWSQQQSHSTFQAQTQQAQERLLQQQVQNQGPLWSQASGASGPVLWPGMEGLGMNKLDATASSNSDRPGSNAGGQVDEETGHGYSGESDGVRNLNSANINDPSVSYSGFRVHDDLENTAQRMREDRKRERGLTPQAQDSITKKPPTKK